MLSRRRPDIASFLAGVALFADIPPPVLQRLAAASLIRRLARGEIVYREGQLCTACHVPLSGSVKLFIGEPEGPEKVIEVISAGQSFAEAPMFLGHPYSVSAQAITASVLVSVPRSAVMAELAQDHDFVLRVLAALSRRLHTLVQDVHAVTLQSGTQRVIGYLLRDVPLQQPAGRPAMARPALPAAQDLARQPCSVRLQVSKAMVASRLALTPEYFSRILHDLEDSQLIRVDKRVIHIPDPALLAAHAR